MPDETSIPSARAPGRRPQQERGERRVAAILDAAAALIGEVGLEGLTVQTLAERANTSKSSLYHFFPDVHAVLGALLDRHNAAIGELVSAVANDPAVDWRALSPEDAADRFAAPLRGYIESRPDLLVLVRAPAMLDRGPKRYAPLLDLADRVLRARVPAMPAGERTARAATMVAVLTGVLGFSMRASPVPHEVMMRELRRVLAGYLRAVEGGKAEQGG
jgi:AcrR family transcriptional regulator